MTRVIETSAPTITYTAEQQITDFKELPKAITVKIYQISAIIGRGHAATAII